MLSRIGGGTVISAAEHKFGSLLLDAASVSLTKEKRAMSQGKGGGHELLKVYIHTQKSCEKGTKSLSCQCTYLHVMKAPPIKMTNVATTSRMIAGGEKNIKNNWVYHNTTVLCFCMSGGNHSCAILTVT